MQRQQPLSLHNEWTQNLNSYRFQCQAFAGVSVLNLHSYYPYYKTVLIIFHLQQEHQSAYLLRILFCFEGHLKSLALEYMLTLDEWNKYGLG